MTTTRRGFGPARHWQAIQGSRHFLVNQGHQNVERGPLGPLTVTQLFTKCRNVMLWKRSVRHRTLVYMLNSWNSIHTSIPSLRLNFNSKRTRNPENYRSVSLLELYTQICAFVSLSLLHFHLFKSVKQYSATRTSMKSFTESYYAPYFDLQSTQTSVATLHKNQVSTVGL